MSPLESRQPRFSPGQVPSARSLLVVVFLVALVINLAGIGHNGFYDEFYHLLAAESWLKHGTLEVGGGTYGRAPYFTILIAWVFDVFGNTLAAARAVSAVAGALLVALVFAWTAQVANVRAALFAAGLLCVSPPIVFQAQIVRFYAIHGLAFFVGAFTLYAATVPDRSVGARLSYLVMSLLAVGLAVSLQLTTLVGIFALAAWAVPRLFRELFTRQVLTPVTLAALGLLAGIGGLVGAWAFEPWLHYLWNAYRSAPLWAAGSRGNFLYYHEWFLDNFPTFWTLLPIAGLVASVRAPRVSLYCAVVFGVALILHSFAGTKGDRYIAYVLPFFFIIWGVALSASIDWLRPLARNARLAVFGTDVPSPFATSVEVAAMVAVAMMIVAGNTAFRTTYKMMAVSETDWPATLPDFRGNPDWGLARTALRNVEKESSVVVSSAGVKSLYFLGRLDYDLSATNVGSDGEQLSRDPRTGSRLISTRGSLDLVIECHPTGLIIIEERHWRNPWAVPEQVADYIEQYTVPVQLPPRTRLLAFTWRRAAGAVGAACREIQRHRSEHEPGPDGTP